MFVNCENIYLDRDFFPELVIGGYLEPVQWILVGFLFQLNFHPSKPSKPSNPPAMALCCRLSNFFRAESVNFSQVFSSRRTRYLTTETWNAGGWLQRGPKGIRSLNGNSMGTLNTGHSCDLILENQALKAPSQRFFGASNSAAAALVSPSLRLRSLFTHWAVPKLNGVPQLDTNIRCRQDAPWGVAGNSSCSPRPHECIAIKTIPPINQNVYLPL